MSQAQRQEAPVRFRHRYRFYLEPPDRSFVSADKVGAIHEALNHWVAAGWDLVVVPERSPGTRRLQLVKELGNKVLGRVCAVEGSPDEHCLVHVSMGSSRKGKPWMPYTYETVRRIAAHEIGHAMGQKHVDRPESIMYGKIKPRYENPRPLRSGSNRVGRNLQMVNFQLRQKGRLSYDLRSLTAKAFNAVIIRRSDARAFAKGDPCNGWAWTKNARNATGTVLLDPGDYALLLRATGFLGTAVVQHDLGWQLP